MFYNLKRFKISHLMSKNQQVLPFIELINVCSSLSIFHKFHRKLFYYIEIMIAKIDGLTRTELKENIRETIKSIPNTNTEI